MRTVMAYFLALAHSSADAQALRGMDAVGSTVDGIFSFMIALMVACAVLGFGLSLARGRVSAAPLLPLLTLPGLQIMRSMLPEFSTPAEPEKDEPGVFDWIGNHWLGLLLGAFAVGSIAYLAVRHFEGRARQRQVKRDRSELLETLGHVDELLQDWSSIASGHQSAKGEKSKQNDAFSTLTAIRDRFMPVLEQVQSGKPMTDIQRARLASDAKTLADPAKTYMPRANKPDVAAPQTKPTAVGRPASRPVEYLSSGGGGLGFAVPLAGMAIANALAQDNGGENAGAAWGDCSNIDQSQGHHPSFDAD